MSAEDTIVIPAVKTTPMQWGPPSDEAYAFGLPLSLFNKADPIKTVSDFATTDRDDTTPEGATQKTGSGFRTENTAQIAALEREKKTKDSSGIKVRRPPPPPGGFKGPYKSAPQPGRGKGGKGGKQPWVRREVVHRAASVSLSDDCTILQRFNLAEGKWTIKPPSAEELSIFQRPRLYNNALDAASPKKPVPLPDASNIDFSRVTTKFDPIIRKITASSQDTVRTIFTTDTILAQIMCSSTQLNSWDVEIQQFKHFTFIDTRDGGNSMVDTYWVDENAGQEAPNDKEDSINNMTQLGRESTMVCRYITEAARTKTQYQEVKTEKTPFSGNTTTFVYRQFTMEKGTENQYRLIVRCEVDCVDIPDKKKKDEAKYTRTFALLERPGQKWRERLEKERGRILMGELQRNRPKFAKWAVLSYLSNVDQIKIALVSRAAPTDNTKHIILGTETMTPVDLLKSLSLRTDILWGLVNQIYSTYRPSVAAHVGLLKEPSVNSLTLFVVPETQDEDGDESSDSDSDSDSDSSDSDDSSSDSSSSDSDSSDSSSDEE